MAVDVEATEAIKAATRPGTTGEAGGKEPIIVDLGKKSRKQVRSLSKGKPCRLLRRVEETVEQLRTSGEIGDNVRPLIVVVRQRPRKKGRRAAKLWGLG
ncbi:hypothetical protein [Chondromyces crocatus]|uniref:Uncharacterized protein n=1 Tax=Chondromyces crocatus TaxID=52 RepID=A0A0K1ED96_CHOCO|nr:hypothetical protein [Chondromyces crocatus]AKT38851.1 uncharacterized protein CMC5_029970 [Chondromyces crocatus]